MPADSNHSFPFLCVCGKTISVNSDAGGQCDGCGRKYSSQAVNASLTMRMDRPAAELIEAPPDDDMIGQSIDHFTIVDRLGDGGMGTVYRAMDESLQRYVALKVIRRGAAGASEAHHVENLLQEARAQARVNHPNVVHIYFVSRDEQSPYLAMELIPGTTLQHRIEAGSLEYKDVVDIGLQVAVALRASTRFDIVHGDIKPSNILLGEGLAKLSDFGLAQRLSQRDGETGRIAGTPNYMAPEVCRGEPATAQSDMYSFGVMLFEMTFGRLPYNFDEASIQSRLEAHQGAPVEFPDSWPADTPESWRPFLEKLLAKSPGDRFASWDELIEALRQLQPLNPVPAGRIQRGIAWGLDMAIQIAAAILVIVSTQWAYERATLADKAPPELLLSCVLVVPAFVYWWIGRGGLSPGKVVMQLRVVDRHGLPLRPKNLARRSIIQFLPIWLIPAGYQSDEYGLPDAIMFPLWYGMLVFFLIQMLLTAVRKGGRSLHDQLFGTRVVLQESRKY